MKTNDNQNAINLIENLMDKVSNGENQFHKEILGKLISGYFEFREIENLNSEATKKIVYLNGNADYLNGLAAKLVKGELLNENEFNLAKMVSDIVLNKTKRLVDNDSVEKLTLKQQYLIFMEEMLSTLSEGKSNVVLQKIKLSNFVNLANILGLYEELSTNTYHQNYQKLEIISEEEYSTYEKKFNQITIAMEQVEKKKQGDASSEDALSGEDDKNELSSGIKKTATNSLMINSKSSQQDENEKRDDVVTNTQNGAEDVSVTANEEDFNFETLKEAFGEPAQQLVKINKEFMRLLECIREWYGEINPVNVSLALYEKVKFDDEDVSIQDILKLKETILVVDEMKKAGSEEMYLKNFEKN